jgi:hypothetical protein
MKAWFAVLPFVLAMHSAMALAQPPAASPLLGQWAVDVSRLPMAPEARPKSVTFTFADAGEGKWATEVAIVDPAGVQLRSFATVALDGTSVPIKGATLEADTVALKHPVPNVLIMALAKDGHPASTRIYSVAADGKTLVETSVYADDKGVPVMRTYELTRIR